MLNLKLLGDGKRVLGQGAQQVRTMAAEGACRTTCRDGRGNAENQLTFKSYREAGIRMKIQSLSYICCVKLAVV